MLIGFGGQLVTVLGVVTRVIEPHLTLPRDTAELNVFNTIDHLQRGSVEHLYAAPIRTTFALLVGRELARWRERQRRNRGRAVYRQSIGIQKNALLAVLIQAVNHGLILQTRVSRKIGVTTLFERRALAFVIEQPAKTITQRLPARQRIQIVKCDRVLRIYPGLGRGAVIVF